MNSQLLLDGEELAKSKHLTAARLVEMRAVMCLEFANSQRFRRRCDKTVN